MNYIEVEWHHQSKEDPIRLVSEYNSDRLETRKLEFFPNGKVGFATTEESVYGTRLAEVPVPTLEEINADAEFTAKPLSAEAFEALWRTHVTQRA